jgi:hypothetical protein
MRQVLTAAFAAAAVCFATTSLPAAPAAGPAGQNLTPLTHLAQGDYFGGYTYGFGLGYGQNYIPACPANYHYSCWHDPYGFRHCGCLINRW